MELLGEAIDAIKDYLPNKGGVTTEQMLEEALQDEDVRKFILHHEISDDTIQTYRSKLIEYHRGTEEGKKLTLDYSDGYRHAIIEVREEPPVVVAKRGKLTLDNATESMRGLNFENLVEDQYNSKVIKSLKGYVNNYDTLKQSPGIWIYGDFGRGKTYMLGALANELVAKGASVAFISARGFAESYVYSDYGEREKYLKRISNQDVVIFDDMGVETLSSKAFEGIYALLDIRLSRLQLKRDKQLTFASSNLSISNYVDKINNTDEEDVNRYLTRLANLFLQFKLGGENKRRR